MGKNKILLLTIVFSLLIGCDASLSVEEDKQNTNIESISANAQPLPQKVSDISETFYQQLNLQSYDPQTFYVIHNGTIIDGTGGDVIANGVIVIQNGLIVSIGSESNIEIPAGAVLIDAKGGTILPGLIDTHVHILDKLFIEEGNIKPIGLANYLIAPLESGVTTVRDLGSHWGATDDINVLQSALSKLGNFIPTVLFSGPILSVSDGVVFYYVAQQAFAVDDLDAVELHVNRILNEGASGIKIFIEFGPAIGSTNTNPDNPFPNLSEKQIQLITSIAHEQGTWVSAHVTDISEALIAAENGVDELAHWPGNEAIPNELLQMLVEKNISIVSTFRAKFPHNGDVRHFLNLGGKLILGTDAPGVIRINAPWIEFSAMTQAGMTPMEVIISSTANAAEAIGIGDAVGTLEEGKVADIIVVVGDLLEDIRLIENVSIVIKNGVIVKNTDLD